MDDRLAAFLRVIDPADNVTGGGAASAVAGAMAAALVGMVARVSIGKAGMHDPDDHYGRIDSQAQELVQALFEGANADSAAFDRVMEAYRLPKATDEEKAARSAAIQRAMEHATDVPLSNAAHCARVLSLARSLHGRSNPNAGSDLDCACFLAEAGLKGALSNAAINIAALKDPEIAGRLQARLVALNALLDD